MASLLGRQVLANVTGSFRPGKSTLILGPPQSGKSSLMKAIAGRLVLSKKCKFSGDIRYAGRALDKKLQKKKGELKVPKIVGYIPQVCPPPLSPPLAPRPSPLLWPLPVPTAPCPCPGDALEGEGGGRGLLRAAAKQFLAVGKVVGRQGLAVATRLAGGGWQAEAVGMGRTLQGGGGVGTRPWWLALLAFGKHGRGGTPPPLV